MIVKNRVNNLVADFTATINLDPKHARALYERGLAYGSLSEDMRWNHAEQGAKLERQKAQKDFSAVVQLSGNEYSSDALIQRSRKTGNRILLFGDGSDDFCLHQ